MSEKQSSGGNTKKKWILIAALAAIVVGAYNYWFSADAYVRRGDELQKQGKRTEAMLYYGKAAEKGSPKDLSMILKLSCEDYARLLKLDPKNPWWYFYRAKDCSSSADEALADYTKAIELGGEGKGQYYRERGGVYSRMFDREHALADAENAAENKMKLVNILSSYGNSMGVSGAMKDQKISDEAIFYYTESIKVFDKIFRDSPATYDPHLDRGKTYALKQNYSQALADYTQVIKNGNVRIKQVENESVKLKYKVQELLDLKSKDNDLNIPRHDMYEAYVRRGDIYKKQGDWANAIENYTKAIEVNEILTSSPEPTIVGASLWKIYACRGECYRSQGDYAKAVFDFTKALEIPDDGLGLYLDRRPTSTLYLYRGFAYQNWGNTEKAVADFAAHSIDLGSYSTDEEATKAAAMALEYLVPKDILYVHRDMGGL